MGKKGKLKMIKLTIHRNNRPPEVLIFHAPSIKIGNNADVSEDSLPDMQVEIFEKNGTFIVYNQANDPFIALNDLPFRKKTLQKEKNLLSIGQILIDIEVQAEKVSSSPPMEKKCKMEKPVEIEKQKNIDIAAHIQEVEALGTPIQEEPFACEIASAPKPESSPCIIDEEPSLESIATAHLESEDTTSNPENPPRKRIVKKNEKKDERIPSFQKSWGFMLSLGAIIMAFITLLLGTIYLKISSESDKDEAKAVETVADAAMALAYAQVSHLKPQKSNWSHPEFLKNSLTTILPSYSRPLIDVDSQGKFNNCPYLLRIYTSSDLTHFLVIAQPSASTWQWLLPRASIVVDSSAMEVRKTTDLKNLNRLLVNVNTLDDLNPKEISQAVGEGKLISLSSLRMSKRAREFSPPKALAHLRPGAENLIYNAPRYHRLGENLINKALQLMEPSTTNEEVTLFQQEVEAIKKLPHLILYSTKGIDGALEGEKALSTFAPKSRFLIGYLKINPHGTIISNHLLMSDEISPKSADSDLTENTDIAVEDSLPLLSHNLVETKTEPVLAETNEQPEDQLSTNPLYLQLVHLSNERKNALKPIQTKMMDLLKKENDEIVIQFPAQFQTLLTEYQEISQKEEQQFSELFFTLYHQYRAIPLKDLMLYVQKAGLEPILDSILKNLTVEKTLTDESFNKWLQDLRTASNFTELYQHVNESIPQLVLDKFPNPQKLIDYQNNYRSEVVAAIERFLLSSEHKLPPSKLQPPAKETFTKILDLCWIIAERDYYLNEFDLLANQETKGTQS